MPTLKQIVLQTDRTVSQLVENQLLNPAMQHFPFFFSETPCGPAATVQTGFFFTLFLFGLHIGDFSLELTPVKLHRGLSLAAAASQVSRHFYTNVNTANYATHTAGPVVLFM